MLSRCQRWKHSVPRLYMEGVHRDEIPLGEAKFVSALENSVVESSILYVCAITQIQHKVRGPPLNPQHYFLVICFP